MNSKGRWYWKNCKDNIRSLKGRLGFPNCPNLHFLGLSLSLKDGSIYDEIRKMPILVSIIVGKAFTVF
jgi:hypothetical protein